MYSSLYGRIWRCKLVFTIKHYPKGCKIILSVYWSREYSSIDGIFCDRITNRMTNITPMR